MNSLVLSFVHTSSKWELKLGIVRDAQLKNITQNNYKFSIVCDFIKQKGANRPTETLNVLRKNYDSGNLSYTIFCILCTSKCTNFLWRKSHCVRKFLASALSSMGVLLPLKLLYHSKNCVRLIDKTVYRKAYRSIFKVSMSKVFGLT